MKNSLPLLILLLVFSLCCAAAHPTQPIYDDKADAHQDIALAIKNAESSGKNIVLDFGANWCGDCHALHDQMQRPELAAILDRGFIVVDVDLGQYDRNLDVAKEYHVPVDHGIPALAVLDKHGKLLYAMDQGQFSDARHMSYESIKAFFMKWVPDRSTT